MSKDGIHIDPLNIEPILALPAPTNVTELQSLQGKENFLRRFVYNYGERTHGFMSLLKKDTPFVWDDFAQRAFEYLKHALTHAPMLQPPNYAKDYSLYVAASLYTIGMVLVQTDEHDQEHVIYYASKSLLDSETRYSHVEKLALATVIVVQKFLYYILLHTTTFYTDSNPMYYILTRQVLGGKYSRWIMILQEFELEFTKITSKKSLVFAELICDLPHTTETIDPLDSFPH